MESRGQEREGRRGAGERVGRENFSWSSSAAEIRDGEMKTVNGTEFLL